MKNIDLKAVTAGHDLNEVAAALFPDNKHPKAALDRLFSGNWVLDENQIIRLSEYLGVPIQDLFTVHGWKARTNAERSGELIFTKGDYSARLDTKFWKTRIFLGGTQLKEEVLHAQSISLSEYLADIDTFISNYKN